MAIAILVDDQLLNQTGPVELSVNRKFQLNVTAEIAQRLVHNWLIDQVSSNIGSETPTLILETHPVWRVPAALSFPRYGRVGTVGFLDVDVESGTLCNVEERKIAIEKMATQLIKRLPSRSTRSKTASDITLSIGSAAPKLHLTEADLQPTPADQSTEMLFFEPTE